MKSIGIIRKIDDLGRIVIPKELRVALNIAEKDSIEIYLEDDKIVLQKYIPHDIFTGSMENLVEYKGKKISVDTITELAKGIGLI